MIPNPGMIFETCDLYIIETDDCVLIGDAIRDLQAAMGGSIPTHILVETGYGRSIMKGCHCNRDSFIELIDQCLIAEDVESESLSNILPCYCTPSLRSAAEWLLST